MTWQKPTNVGYILAVLQKPLAEKSIVSGVQHGRREFHARGVPQT